jgi:nucleoid-associated protein YgaU
MGLFDFVRDIGKKIFGNDAEAADKIKAEIEATNPGLTGVGVQYNPTDGRVTLSGAANSAEAMQKAVLIAGNIQGVGQVDIAGLQHPPEKEKVEYYVIQKGDNLSKIAKHFYGDANQYPKIFAANREVIKDANLIFPGQKIRIPLGS